MSAGLDRRAAASRDALDLACRRPRATVRLAVVLAVGFAACGGPDAGAGEGGRGATAGGSTGGAGAAPAESATGATTPGAAAAARELPCRCAQRTLAEYYGDADEVMMGRLVATSEVVNDVLLDFDVTGRPWKLADERTDSVGDGARIRLATAASSATCGIETRVGAVYAIFARTDPDGGPARVDSCGGTRVHTAEGMDAPQGFDDVPGDFVARQLDALSGMDVLRRVAENAPDESDPANTSLVGLLDLEPLAHGGTIDVRERADADAPVVRRVDGWVDLDAYEVGYEVPAVAVVARLDGWYRIRFADQSLGWIEAEAGGTWFPYENLPVNSLAYLTAAWTGHVWPDIGAGIPTRSARKGAQEREEYPVEVQESRMLGGMLWFRIDVLNGSPCYSGEVNPELSGWIPAYGPSGEPAVWYYSRGC